MEWLKAVARDLQSQAFILEFFIPCGSNLLFSRSAADHGKDSLIFSLITKDSIHAQRVDHLILVYDQFFNANYFILVQQV